jgi:hypothetical protein
MLALPYAAASLGWSAVVMLCILASVFTYAFSVVAEVIESCIASFAREKRERMAPRVNGESLRDNAAIERSIDDFASNLNYVTLGERAFGPRGATLILIGLSTELFLALVSFLINLGLNISFIDSSFPVSWGIVLCSFITLLMAFLDLKYAAYTSAIGSALTVLLMVALLISGAQLPPSSYVVDPFGERSPDLHRPYNIAPGDYVSPGSGSESGPISVSGHRRLSLPPHAPFNVVPNRVYRILVPNEAPISLGLIAFCFGGIGAL